MSLSTETLSLITKIQVLCVKVSTETEHDAFFRYSGHTNTIDVNVDVGGTKNTAGIDDSIWLLHCEPVNRNNVDLFEECVKSLEDYLA